MRAARWIGTLILAAGFAAGMGYPIDVQDGRPVADGVFVNGHGPYRFLVDTGAETNQIDAGLAKEVGLAPEYSVEMETAARGSRVGATRNVRVRFAGVEARGTEMLLTDLGGVRAWRNDVRGVLGQAFLGQFRFRLDFRKRRIEFGIPEAAGLRVPIETVEGRPAVRTSVGRLTIDSGTDRLILFGEPRTKGGALRTAAGSVPAERVRGGTLVIEGREYRFPETLLVVRPDRMKEDGLLPAAALGAIFFEPSRTYIVIQ